ncbi:YdcH family protein [Thermodesulfobacterium hydrogeniphilum]|uniref:YdcH family protein n=1 Tax=Thermodesulfobacterium hydrogeniphilum TaxID=161156 RepID=UPI00056EAE85|nr:YdcH family protein [Thermodesulfobacterium hydrogeniphilum]
MDKEFVKKFAEKYSDIKDLFEKHQALEKEVDELSKKLYLTQEEEVKVKQLKKEKLHIKEKIYQLIKNYEGVEID